MKNVCFFLSFIFSVFTANLFATPNIAQSHQTTSDKLGVLVPFYVDPSPAAINPLITAAQANPNVPLRVIINPDNGVGARKQSVYAAGSAALKNANISTLGYVNTNRGHRPISEVKMEISTWVSWYNPDGIFLDDMADTADHHYYIAITSYAKSLGIQYVVGNPGDNHLPTSSGHDVDTIIVYEDAGLPNPLSQFHKWAAAGYHPSKIGMIAYSISALPKSFIFHVPPIFGWIYITNGKGSNPYDKLPSYLSGLMAYISSLNQ